MRAKALLSILVVVLLAAPGWTAPVEKSTNSESPPTLAELNNSLRTFSEGLFLEKSTQAEQAAIRAQTPSDFSMELRPRVSDDDAGVALRIYLPNRWDQKALRAQLELAAQSEELRVAELEGQALLTVYRDFCTYRMLRKNIALYTDEMELIQPYLGLADQSVQQRELAVLDRAELYSAYLNLLNDRDQLEIEWIENQRDLHRALGGGADLDAFADIVKVELPSERILDDLLQQALDQRADYRRLDVEAQALEAAEDLARAKEGFRFKYVQPAYNANYTSGEDTWALSAAFVLPWGARNPDIAELQERKELADFEMELQRRIVQERLQSLLQASEAFQEQLAKRNRLIQPLLNQLVADIGQMKAVPLEQLRNRLQILQRIRESAVQTATAECKRELLAVDFAEALGSLQP